MSKNYFAISRQGKYLEPVILTDHNGNFVFQDLINRPYDQMKQCEEIDNFVVAAMDAANRKMDGEDCLTIVSLIDGNTDLSIWNIIMTADQSGDGIKYAIVKGA